MIAANPAILGTDPLIVPVTMTLTKADLGVAKKQRCALHQPSRSEDMMEVSSPGKIWLLALPRRKWPRSRPTVEKGHGRYRALARGRCIARKTSTPDASSATLRTWLPSMLLVLNRAKQLYREKGTASAATASRGFDNQDEELVSARQTIAQLDNQKTDDRLQIAQLNKKGDTAPDNATANRYYAEATNLTVTMSGMDAKDREQLDRRSANLLREIKKGSARTLKEVRMKIHKEWIPNWLKHTHEWRPTTKMPQFRLQDDEIQAISAYIWQSAITGPELPKQSPGQAPPTAKCCLKSGVAKRATPSERAPISSAATSRPTFRG